MYLGTQMQAREDDDLRIMSQLGVTHICANPKGDPNDWTSDSLSRHRERI